MLAAHSLSLSLHSSPTPTTRPHSLLNFRPALADSTNVNSHSSVCSPAYLKSCVYPTSSARTDCGWNDFEPSAGSISVQSRYHNSSSTPSPFPVTSKAPPTVSISLSAACSQSIPGERLRGSPVQRLEPDLPDVRSVVPFPSTPSDGDMDVDMLDGTCSDGRFASARQAPRKRHSAHSSVSSSPSSLRKDAKQKRPRKSKRQVAELWWLGVVHRTILRGIEARGSTGMSDASDKLLSGPRELDAMDRVLVEKIQRRLAENGCVEGRALPNPLPRMSSPTVFVPSLNLVAPNRKTLPTGSASLSLASELNPKGSGGILNGVAISPSTLKAPPCASLSINSHSATLSSASTSHRRQVRFETSQRAHQPQPHPSIPRRSPSPPPRTGTIPTSAQTLTLTMPQLVASLTLAYHERNGLRLRGRSYKVAECWKNRDAGRSPLSVPSQGVQRSDDDMTYDKVHESFISHARQSSTPERKSPLSCVVYAES